MPDEFGINCISNSSLQRVKTIISTNCLTFSYIFVVQVYHKLTLVSQPHLWFFTTSYTATVIFSEIAHNFITQPNHLKHINVTHKIVLLPQFGNFSKTIPISTVCDHFINVFCDL